MKAYRTLDGCAVIAFVEFGAVKEDLIFLFTDGVSPFAPPAEVSRPLILVDAATYRPTRKASHATCG